VIAGTSAYILHQTKNREISAKSIFSHLPDEKYPMNDAQCIAARTLVDGLLFGHGRDSYR
jgi:hypothetical protein